MPFLERGDAKIHYEHHGSQDSDKPLIVFSHAYGASMNMWRGQLDEALKTHQAVIWNMRGHGRSVAETYNHAEALADIAALIELTPHGKAILCGLSLGGYLSLLFALKHPEKVEALLLADTGPGFRKQAAREQWNDTAERQARVLEKRGLAARPKAPGSETHESAQGLADAARGLLAQQDGEVMERLLEITCPMQLVVGADDKPFLGAVDYMEAKLPQAQKQVIGEAGHFVNCDQPQAFNKLMRGFLDRLAG